MKITIIFLLLLLANLGFGQFANFQKIPVDSADYFAFYSEEGVRISQWKKCDALIVNSLEDFYTFRIGNKWGVCNANLKTLLPANFVNVYKKEKYIFAENYNSLLILSENLDTVLEVSEFLSIAFDPIFERNYYNANDVINSNLIVKTAKGVGILNSAMEWVIEPQYDNAFFMDDVVYIRQGDLFGFIGDSDLVIHPKWSKIGTFNDAIIEVWDENKHRSYYLKNGRLIPDSDSTLVYHEIYKTYKIYKNGKAELYDTGLNKRISYEGDDIFQLSIKNHYKHKEGSKTTTEFAIKKNGKIGLINEQGKTLIAPKYENIRSGNQGLYIVMLDGKFGVVKQNDTPVIPCEYTFIERERDYFKLTDGRKRGYVSLTNDSLVPIEFDYVRINQYGFITKRNGKHGFYTFKGEKILDPIMGKLHNENGGLEMETAYGRCMLGTNGLLTPLNCIKIRRTNELIKYYLNDKIVIHNLKEDRILDTTYYPYNKSVYISGSHRDLAGHSIGESNHTTFTDQLTGKIGSINKLADGYAITPRFFNIHYTNGHFNGVISKDDFLSLDNAFISVKEMLVPFYGDDGFIEDPLYALVEPKSATSYTDVDYDPIIDMNKQWRFHGNNRSKKNTYSYVFRQQGYTTAALNNGELNFSEGHNLMSFKAYYEDLNSGHNLFVTTKYEFDRLAKSPMIKVKDSEWTLFSKKNNDYNKRLTTTSHFYLLDYTTLILKKEGGNYSIYFTEKEEYMLKNALYIIEKKVDYANYIMVKSAKEDARGIVDLKWDIYDRGGRKILQKSYDTVEVIAPNAFKIYKDNYEQIIDSTGKYISVSKIK